jgi:hypothetical protein
MFYVFFSLANTLVCPHLLSQVALYTLQGVHSCNCFQTTDDLHSDLPPHTPEVDYYEQSVHLHVRISDTIICTPTTLDI